VRHLQFSADGKQLAILRGTKMIRMDVATGRQVGEFPGSTTLGMTLDRGWSRVAIATDAVGGPVEIGVLDAKTGAQLAKSSSGAAVTGVFSPDGKKIAVALFTQPTRVFDSDTGALVATMEHGGGVVGFAAGGKELVFFAGDENWHVHVSDATTGKKLRDLPKPHIYCVPYVSPDGSRSAYPEGDAPDKFRIFETATGKRVCELDAAEERRPGAFTADNATFAYAQPHAIRLSDAQTGKTLRRCKFSAGCTHIVFSPDGKTLAGGDADGWIRLWDVATGELRNQSPLHSGPVHAVALRPDGARLISIGAEGTLIEWDAGTGKALEKTSVGRQLLSAAAASKAQKAVLQAEGDLVIWDLVEPARRQMRIHNGVIGLHQRVRAIDDQGKLVAYTGNPEGVFDAVKAKSQATADSHQRAAAAFSPAGDLLLQAGENRWHQQLPALSLVDPRTGQRLAAVPEQENYQAAQCHPAGTLVALATPTKAIRLFDLRTGAVLRAIDDLPSPAVHLAWRGDGKWLASVAQDGTLLIHDVSREKAALVSEVPLGAIAAVIRRLEFTPDGRHLVTTNANGTVFVLRLALAK
jgi:WD40 repeat protein